MQEVVSLSKSQWYIPDYSLKLCTFSLAVESTASAIRIVSFLMMGFVSCSSWKQKTPSERTKSLAHKWYSICNSSFPYFLIKALILSITFYFHWPMDSSQQTVVDTTEDIIISFYWEACWHSKRSHVMSYVIYVMEPGLQPRPSVSKLKP